MLESAVFLTTNAVYKDLERVADVFTKIRLPFVEPFVIRASTSSARTGFAPHAPFPVRPERSASEVEG